MASQDDADDADDNDDDFIVVPFTRRIKFRGTVCLSIFDVDDLHGSFTMPACLSLHWILRHNQLQQHPPPIKKVRE